MSKQTWMQWLSGIALVMVILDVLSNFWAMFISGETIEVTSTGIEVLFLAIVVAMIVFSKAKKK
jgi:hypothetical protein